MKPVTVRIGFVPSFRFHHGSWCERMRAESLVAFESIEEMEVVVPQPAPDGQAVSVEEGVTPHGAVNTLDQAEAVAEYFRAQKVNGLIICPLDFGDERSAAKIAEMLRVPVLLYATKEPPQTEDASLARVSDSYCGNLGVSSALYRRGIPFHFAGLFFPDEPEFARQVGHFVSAVAVVSGLRGARLGQVGVRPTQFETVAYDEAALIRKFEQNVIHANLSDITDAAKAYADDDARVEEVLADIHQSVPTITVGRDYLLNAAKMEVALADFWTGQRLSAMAMQCWPSAGRLMGMSMCALYGRLTQRGMLTACETDVVGALAMLTSYRAALGRTVPHFIDWTIQHRQEPNWLLAWHCGNAPTCLAKSPDQVALRSRRDMKGDLPIQERDGSAGLYQFQIKPGHVTLCRLVEYDNEWKMLITTGEIVPTDETLAGTWAWVEVRDHAKLYRILVEEGFIHHASMAHGDQAPALLQVCKFLDITPVVVE